MSGNHSNPWTTNSAAASVDVVEQADSSNALPGKNGNGLALLETLYTFNNPFKLKSFLEEHNNGLIDHLIQAHAQIKKVFEENAVDVCLEYANDPEENFEGLFVIVKTMTSPEEALDLLDRFDEEWFLDHVSSEFGALFVVKVRPV